MINTIFILCHMLLYFYRVLKPNYFKLYRKWSYKTSDYNELEGAFILYEMNTY